MTESIEKSSLTLLQCRLKKDPESYKDSFDNNYKEFNELWKTFLLNPSSHEEELITLVMFIAQVCHCYKDQAGDFACQIKSILSKFGPQLDADMRLTFCKVLILLRNKSLISPVEILKLFFELFRCPDKVLRETLKNYVVQDIKNINKKSKNVSLNSELQNFMFLMLKDGNITASKISLDIVIELYNRKIWNNAKTANIISTGLFSKSPKIVMAALKFFVGTEEEEEDNDSDDDNDIKPTQTKNAKQVQLAYRVGKKNNKREKRMKRALDMIQSHKKKKRKTNTCFSALHLLNDPQDLADRVFGQLDRPKVNEMLSVRIMKLKFVSQLVGTHKLILLQFYPFLDRYLKPSQKEVTKILLYLAQACHELVPPDVITSSIRTLANNFVTERNSNEVMAVGINTIREVCKRCPLAMDADLLHDLALYKKYKDRCVSMAAQSLIGLFRTINPDLLHRSFLGKPTLSMIEREKALGYGELGAKDYLPGAEILPDENDPKEKKNEDEQEAWESCSDDDNDDDSDGSWVDVSHSSEGEEDEEGAVKLTKEEKVEKSRKVFESRILTEEDFSKLESYQKKRNAEFFKKGGNKREHSEAFPEESAELLSLSNIENVDKKRKHDKESRLATVLAGREGRTKFGEKKPRMNEFASTSNKEKQRNKNFLMVRQKAIKKNKKATYQDKKESLKKYLLGKLKQKSK